MRKVGVKNACLSFAWARDYKAIDWKEELSFLSNLIVDHGYPQCSYIDESELPEFGSAYVDFLNEHSDIIHFAFEIPELGCFVQDNCPDVEIVPFFARDIFNYILDQPLVAITAAHIGTPFFANYYKQMRDETAMHGYNLPRVPNDLRLDSISTMAWLLGKYGYSYEFDGKTLNVYSKKKSSYRSVVARKLIAKGYDLNYNKVLKDDMDEVNHMNLIAWREYSDTVAHRRK